LSHRRKTILESSDEETFGPSSDGNTLSQQSNRVEDDDTPTGTIAITNNTSALAGRDLFPPDITTTTAVASANTFVLSELPQQPLLQTIKPLQSKLKGPVTVPKSAKLNKMAMSYVETANQNIRESFPMVTIFAPRRRVLLRRCRAPLLIFTRRWVMP
jgi:hypothetical protein